MRDDTGFALIEEETARHMTLIVHGKNAVCGINRSVLVKVKLKLGRSGTAQQIIGDFANG